MARRRKVTPEVSTDEAPLSEVDLPEGALEETGETPEVATTEVALPEDAPEGAPAEAAAEVVPPEVTHEEAPGGAAAEVTPLETPVESPVAKTPIKDLSVPKKPAKKPSPLRGRQEERRSKNQLRFVR